jgi:uncharacterized protein YbjT (DUF2867 family)
MYAISGVTGHVGSAAATALLAKGEPVRALVRDPAKGEAWARQGAEVAVADLNDRAALAAALRGARGFFAMLPTNYAATDFLADHHRTAASIAGAVADSGVPHVVALSSLGADLAEGTGVLLTLHDLENELRATGTVLSALRPGHFQEGIVEERLGAARDAGIYPHFGEDADVPSPMVATRDVGAVAAETLLSPPAASQVVDIDRPTYTARQVAEKLGAALGKPLQVVTIPKPGWAGALVDAGIPPHLAELLTGLYDAEERGVVQARGDRQLRGETEIDETLREVVRAHS